MITRRTLIAAGAAGMATRALPAHAAPRGDAAVLSRLLGLEQELHAAYDAAGHRFAAHSAEQTARLERAVLEIGGAPPAPAARPPGDDLAALEEAVLGAWVAAIGRLADARWVQLGATIAASHAQHLVVLRDELIGPFAGSP